MPNDTLTTEWTPERIRKLRKERGQTQAEFGAELFSESLTERNGRRQNVARLEMDSDTPSSRSPSSAVVRTLERMAEGEI